MPTIFREDTLTSFTTITKLSTVLQNLLNRRCQPTGTGKWIDLAAAEVQRRELCAKCGVWLASRIHRQV